MNIYTFEDYLYFCIFDMQKYCTKFMNANFDKGGVLGEPSVPLIKYPKKSYSYPTFAFDDCLNVLA